MKAIQVRYLGPTNFRGARMKASAEGVKSLTLGFDYAINGDQVRAQFVATEFAIKNDWLEDIPTAYKSLIGGQLPNGDYVFCFKNQ